MLNPTAPLCRSDGAHATCRFRRTLQPPRYLIDPRRCSICDYGVTDRDDEVAQRDLRRGGGETFRIPTGESTDYFRIFRALIPQAQKLTVRCIFPGLVPPCAVFYGSRFREIVLVVRLLPVGPFLPAAQPIGPYEFQDHGDGH